MAELAVFNIAKSLLVQLSSPAKDELFLWYNSKTELEKLENTVTSIKDVLHDAEQRQATDTAVQGWLLRLRDEMYKADDLFDSISTRALRKRVMSGNKILRETRLFFSKSNHLAFIVSTAHKVKELRERLDSIAKDINQFGFIRRAIADERPIIKIKAPSHSYVRDDQVIGREKDKEGILKLLLADTGVEERVSVIAVVGIGGLGKTALAQLVYNAKDIKDFFDLRLWAFVNDFSNLNEALEKMIASGTEERPIGLQLDQLKDKLWKRIHGKKFFLVLDDVWSDIREQWLHLKELLDAGEVGSKILLTTQSMTVAQNLSTVRPCYALEELSDEHAWLLFKKMAFGSNQEVEKQAKEALGRKIVNKCPNVPLAIRTIASFLYNKDKRQWAAFVDNELMTVIPSIENLIMQALRVSYNDLPPSLKHCFVYCSLFPKGYEFDKTTLIHLWMAQGLLDVSTANQCLEDVGESYFFTLTERCFFQDVMVDSDGRILSCKMHHLFHDLTIEISGNECLKIRDLDDFRGKSSRHLLVGEIKGSTSRGKGTRSLVSLVAGFAERSVLDGSFLNLRSLRTLSLRHLDIKELPSSIGKLIHLRYIDLMKSEKLIKIPDALCKLQNLLILRLGGCSNLIKLPDSLQKLISLRYLEVEGCDKLNYIPSGLKEMTSLVMLDRLVVNKDHGGLRSLKCLNNLTGGICIELPAGQWKDCVVEAEESMLRSKTKLSKLSISWRRPTEGEELLEADAILDKLQPPISIDHLCVANFAGVKFPNWLSSLVSLVELVLKECSRCVELPHLRQLFHLKRLTLECIPFLEYLENGICCDSRSFFPSLESLQINYMPMLKGWWRPVGEEVCVAHQLWFPRLSTLFVIDCPELTQLPSCPFVEYLDLDNVNVNLVRQFVQRAPERVELDANSSLTPSVSSHQTCCRLHTLCLDSIKNLAFLPDEFKHLSTIRKLLIIDCPNFKRHSLFLLLPHLGALESLSFEGCHETDLLVDEYQEKDGMPWITLTRLKRLAFEFGSDQEGARLLKGLHHLTSLEYLEIFKELSDYNDMQWKAPSNIKILALIDIDKVAHLNSVIQQLKKLQVLEIGLCKVDEHELDKLPWEDLQGLRSLRFIYMPMLTSLPDKCRHVSSLKELDIVSCSELTSLPDWIGHLTSLSITDCPLLRENCRKPMGSCWPLIQSIPYLNIYATEREIGPRDFQSSWDVMTYSEFSRRNC